MKIYRMTFFIVDESEEGYEWSSLNEIIEYSELSHMKFLPFDVNIVRVEKVNPEDYNNLDKMNKYFEESKNG